MKVILIDDEEIIREGLKYTIDWDALDCEIVGEGEDGEEGLLLIEKMNPDIILTDIRMPGLNGLEMISKIKNLNAEAKIIILTGFRDFEYAQEAVRLGAFRFLLKPTKIEELKDAMREAVKELKKNRSNKEEVKQLKKKIKEYYGIEGEAQEEKSASREGENSCSYLANKAIVLIKREYNKDISLKSISEQLYISTWHLSKVLKKETGSTFINILNEIRVQEAKKLLQKPKNKIYEIAELVGIEDVSYFNRLFKKLTGVTPMEYRASIKEEY